MKPSKKQRDKTIKETFKILMSLFLIRHSGWSEEIYSSEG